MMSMDNAENQAFRTSTMKSSIPKPLPLANLSESQSNVRHMQSGLPPPSRLPAGLKRETPQPASESAPKRQTLAERAGEYPDKPPSTTKKQMPRGKGHVQGQSLSSATGVKMPTGTYSSRQGSTTSSVSTSRHTSNTSFASSVGPGRYAQHDRPKTSMSNRPAPGRSRATTSISRPQTAYGTHSDDDFDEGTGTNAFEVDERLKGMDEQMAEIKQAMATSISDRLAMDEFLEAQKRRVVELEDSQKQKVAELEESQRKKAGELEEQRNRNLLLQSDLTTAREQLQRLTFDMEAEKRAHSYAIEDETRKHRNELDELRKELREETDRVEKSHREALEALDRHYRAELEDERSAKSREVQDLRLKLGNEQQDLHLAMQKKDREVSDMRGEVESLKGDLGREKSLKKGLEANITELAAANITLEAKINSLKSHVEFLESDNKAQSDSFSNMEARLQDALRIAEEARQKLIKEETERRILFNKYQELKGNIRVMCRVRPALSSAEGEVAKIEFPDEKTSAEIAVQGAEEVTAMGRVSRKNFNFEFDRVFDPSAQNQDVFDEISQLVQSALDGYNVCIFCYGQTGSGKTHTMSSEDGMIPRATHMIYDTITKLKEKSWTYTMEGSFIEVYNEELNDLLTPNTRDSGRKLEIRHDEIRKQTHVTNCKTVSLDSPNKVEVMLQEAQSNRSVAATKANERSSRSHSVFILKLVGYNAATGERCEGTLNLVDLAGSERLKHSGAEGDRMRETQNINKSLSCLGDVIEALGRGNGHVPYRNSKLTHLLQYSLGGNSKTLMFVMVSPLEAHLKETVTSLRFATKVHNTHIGTAKAMKKV